jgi:hypothetical protein
MRMIPRNNLRSEFSDMEPYFDKFCSRYPEFNKYRMLEDLIRGESVVWKGSKCIVIGRPNYYHNCTNFLLEAIGGEDLTEWVDDLRGIETQVKEMGFDTIEFYGRLEQALQRLPA